MRIKGLVIIVTIIVIAACSTPRSKESYLTKYESYVERVEKNHKDYKKKDWVYADKKIEQFNTDYYKKFESELTLKEQLKIGALRLKYNSLKGGDKFGKALKKETQKLKNDIKFYLENNMDEDLDKLIQGAEEIGDSLGVVIEDLVEEIRSKL